MPGRTIAIGDIHGCSAAFRALIDAIEPTQDDLLVLLGDMIDRGPDSKGVLDLALELSQEIGLISILGNHEQMLLAFLEGPGDPLNWLFYGGQETLESYGPEFTAHHLPMDHLDFIESCVSHFETSTHFFVHAGYYPDAPLYDQMDYVLRWESLRGPLPPPHVSGRTAIVGHTPQKSGEILDVGHLKCIDTWCYGGGWLTALDVHAGTIWQADIQGRLRSRD